MTINPGVRATTQVRGNPRSRANARWCYLFVLPSLVLAGLFTFWPLVASWYYSTLDWSGFGSTGDFIGMQNYRELLADQYFWNAFGNSFLFMTVTVPIRLALALLVAIILNDVRLRLAPIFRTLFFLPVVTTTAIIGILMTFLLSPRNGPVNQILMSAGLIELPLGFLSDPEMALWSVMGVSIWKSFGISMIYWLAALQSIPSELYEAARMDCASRIRSHLHITLPLMKPFAIIIILITAANTLRIFDLVQTMTQGGPYFATEVMEVYIYRTAFSVTGGGIPRLGLASAAGVLFGVTVMLIALGQGWAARRVARLRRDLGAGDRT